MDYLWTPWRYAYITGAGKPQGCLFCRIAGENDDDEKNFVVHRARHCFIVLNAFPYTSGHSMIVPYEHTAELHKLSAESATEMMSLTRRLEAILRKLYHPDGMNLGMNLGQAAGAGVADHLHMHILPRWIADANFMTTIGETRLLPEDLKTTYERMKKALDS